MHSISCLNNNRQSSKIFLRNLVDNTPDIREYIDHVENGISLRIIAKRDGVHPSTVMRRVRKIEAKRDDPLLDDVLNRISKAAINSPFPKETSMTLKNNTPSQSIHEKTHKDLLRILRRLSEQDAFMVMSVDLPKAVVMRGRGKKQVRSAVLSREMGQELLVKDWISRIGGGKFHRYEITSSGLAALRRFLTETGKENDQNGFADTQTPFQDQHRVWGTRDVSEEQGTKRVKMRVNLRESPIAMLARKKGRDGEPFLSQEMMQAGERLREDFELSQLGPRVAQNWDRFLTGSDRGGFGPSDGDGGSSAAHRRLRKALTALGPDLSDIALRCCCFLEGLEVAEKRLGWSARSGKIVLRIALQRLLSHYRDCYGGIVQKIG